LAVSALDAANPTARCAVGAEHATTLIEFSVLGGFGPSTPPTRPTGAALGG
jgi:hypothetical protein